MLLLVGLLGLGPPAPREVPVIDPVDGVARVYRGLPLIDLLAPSGGGDAVLVRCLDGFVALFPLELVRRLGPVVADAQRGAGGWEPIPSPRGPRYLVWPNRAHPELDRDPAITSEGWAWAVAEVSTVSAASYLRPVTPSGRDARVARGRRLWLASCFHCHALSGAGGAAGWDLAWPTPVWRYLDERRIAAYLADPRAVNPDGHMPAQQLTAAERDSLFAFLHAAVPR